MIASQHIVMFFVSSAMKISVSYRREAPVFLPVPENDFDCRPYLKLVSSNRPKGQDDAHP